jgi:hypothetical protein
LDEPEGFIKCAELLKENGAKMVIVIATHAVLGQAENDEALRKINNSKIDRIIVSNSIPMEESGKVCFRRRSSILRCLTVDNCGGHVIASVRGDATNSPRRVNEFHVCWCRPARLEFANVAEVQAYYLSIHKNYENLYFKHD